MRIERFEDLKTWQKGQDLAIFIYKSLGHSRDFSFRDQICRASVSVSNNIAEGFDRGGNKEFVHFLYIARGSNSEVKSMLYLAKSLEYITEPLFNEGINLCDENGKLINGFITYLLTKGKPN